MDYQKLVLTSVAVEELANIQIISISYQLCLGTNAYSVNRQNQLESACHTGSDTVE